MSNKIKVACNLTKNILNTTKTHSTMAKKVSILERKTIKKPLVATKNAPVKAIIVIMTAAIVIVTAKHKSINIYNLKKEFL